MSILITLRQPVAIWVTVSLILIKLTNDHFIFYIQKTNIFLAKHLMQLELKKSFNSINQVFFFQQRNELWKTFLFFFIYLLIFKFFIYWWVI